MRSDTAGRVSKRPNRENCREIECLTLILWNPTVVKQAWFRRRPNLDLVVSLTEYRKDEVPTDSNAVIEYGVRVEFVHDFACGCQFVSFLRSPIAGFFLASFPLANIVMFEYVVAVIPGLVSAPLLKVVICRRRGSMRRTAAS